MGPGRRSDDPTRRMPERGLRRERVMAMPLIDRPPSKWLGRVLRVPVFLYRWRLGFVLGERFVLVHHTGRRSGLARRTVLEVVHVDVHPPAWYVVSAWGTESDWFRNLRARSDAAVTQGRHRYPVEAAVVDPAEAAGVYEAYRRRHPLAARILGRVVGADLARSDPAELALRMPVVKLRRRMEGGD